MERLDGSYAVTLDGGRIGTLNVFGDGGFTVFEFHGEAGGLSPMRLCCRCGDAVVPIGIPVPENGALRLRKRFTKNALRTAGLSHIDGCALAPLSEPVSRARLFADPPDPPEKNDDGEWRCEYEPWNMFTDDDIKNACRGISGALRRRRGDIDELAVPVSPYEPFPMIPVFCFGEIEEINGRQYVVFTVKSGKLV